VGCSGGGQGEDGMKRRCGEAAEMGVDLWKSIDGVVEVDAHCCYCLLSAGCTEFCYSNLRLHVHGES
jgi:hypothetical protein